MDETGRKYLYSPELENKLTALETGLQECKTGIATLTKFFGSSASVSELKLSENNIKNTIRTNTSNITKLQEKLDLVMLPEDTRYYLAESEISDFRANFMKLVTMMAELNTLYESLVAYQLNSNK